MPKNIIFESFRHQFLTSARNLVSRNIIDEEGNYSPEEKKRFSDFINSLEFNELDNSKVQLRWSTPTQGDVVFGMKGDINFYYRGDNERSDRIQTEKNLKFSASDTVQEGNAKVFERYFAELCERAKIGFSRVKFTAKDKSLHSEEHFHDDWANQEDLEHIDVYRAGEAITAPEMRHITRKLGDLRGKKLLDIGCGLGEASVYFALKGASVTSSDLSQKMLDFTKSLAQRHGVDVRTVKANAEALNLPPGEKFDVVYMGNVLHHVDMAPTLERVKEILKPDGMLVSWDPLAYNPVINVYRRVATNVRTEDEHPLTYSDIRKVKENFKEVECGYYWLTTLIIFVLMAAKYDPNKIRFWKKVIWDSDRYAWFYGPLAQLDRLLLKAFPFLRPLCWNVVMIAKGPIMKSAGGQTQAPENLDATEPPRVANI